MIPSRSDSHFTPIIGAVAAIAVFGVGLLTLSDRIDIVTLLVLESVLVTAILLLVIWGLFKEKLAIWRSKRAINAEWRRVAIRTFGDFRAMVDHLGRFIGGDRIQHKSRLSRVYETLSVSPKFTPMQAFPQETALSRMHYMLRERSEVYDPKNGSLEEFKSLVRTLSDLVSVYCSLVKQMVDMLRWLGPYRKGELEKEIAEIQKEKAIAKKSRKSELDLWSGYDIDDTTQNKYHEFREELTNFLAQYDNLVTKVVNANARLMNYSSTEIPVKI